MATVRGIQRASRNIMRRMKWILLLLYASLLVVLTIPR